MKQFINNRKIFNLRVLSLVFVLCLALQFMVFLATPLHPTLASLLSLVESIGWLCFFVILITLLLKFLVRVCVEAWVTITANIGNLFDKFPKKQKKGEIVYSGTVANGDQIAFLNRSMTHLFFALHGTTEEKVSLLSPMVLPAHNAALYNEFQALVRYLKSFGLPQAEKVCMAEADFAFAQSWLISLNNRVSDLQEQVVEQALALFASLESAKKNLNSLGREYPTVLEDERYHRIQGALVPLEMMGSRGSIPCNELLEYVEVVQSDIAQLRKQLKSTPRKHASLRTNGTVPSSQHNS